MKLQYDHIGLVASGVRCVAGVGRHKTARPGTCRVIPEIRVAYWFQISFYKVNIITNWFDKYCGNKTGDSKFFRPDLDLVLLIIPDMDDFSSEESDLDTGKLKSELQLCIPKLHPTIGVVDDEAKFFY